MELFEFEVVAVKEIVTKWTLKAPDMGHASRLANDVAENSYNEVSYPQRATAKYTVTGVKMLGEYVPTYLVTQHGYYFEIENFGLDYVIAKSTFARTLGDVRVILRIVHDCMDPDISACYTLRRLAEGKFAFTDDRGISDVFLCDDIEKWLRDFVN